MTTTTAQYPTIDTTGPHTGDAPPLTVQALADKYHALFSVGTDNEGELFWRILAPTAQLSELIEKACNGAPIDDYKYWYVYNALLHIVKSIEGMEAEAADGIIADTSSSDLLQWLSSNLSRPGYVDEYLEECSRMRHAPELTSLYSIMAQGQMLERQEIFHSVLESLQKLTKRA